LPGHAVQSCTHRAKSERGAGWLRELLETRSATRPPLEEVAAIVDGQRLARPEAHVRLNDALVKDADSCGVRSGRIEVDCDWFSLTAVVRALHVADQIDEAACFTETAMRDRPHPRRARALPRGCSSSMSSASG